MEDNTAPLAEELSASQNTLAPWDKVQEVMCTVSAVQDSLCSLVYNFPWHMHSGFFLGKSRLESKITTLSALAAGIRSISLKPCDECQQVSSPGSLEAKDQGLLVSISPTYTVTTLQDVSCHS